jgi:hypothetical protein
MAVTPPVLGGGTEGEENTIEIDPHDPAPLVVGHLEDGALAAARDAGIGDAIVDMAHDLDRLGEARLDLLLVADIDDLGMHLAAKALQLLGSGDILGRVCAPDADVGAGFGQGFGHAEADAAVAAGDQ